MKSKIVAYPARIEYHHATYTLYCLGTWTLYGINQLERTLSRQLQSWHPVHTVDASGINKMDTGGAWLFNRLMTDLKQRTQDISYQGLQQEHQKLLELIHNGSFNRQSPITESSPNALEQVGRLVWTHLEETLLFLAFIGETFIYLLRSIAAPSRIRWRSFLSSLQTAGINALPIIGLLVFLVGIVLAYQGGIQLRTYGANIF